MRNLSKLKKNLKMFLVQRYNLLANNKKGKIMIEYYSNDELERIMELVDKIGKI